MFTSRVCALAVLSLQVIILGATNNNPSHDIKNVKSIYDFSAKDIYGNDVSLEKYKGHVCIIVNVASECGLTNSNYEELNQLYEKYGASHGLRILGFPSNEFGSQEPGTSEDILKFAKSKGVQFDLFSKIEVNGENAHPLWKYLKSQQGGFLVDGIKWNFTKFLIDQQGQVVDRYAPTTSPSSIEKDLQKLFGRNKTNGEL